MEAGLERLKRIAAYAERKGALILLGNLNKEPEDSEVRYLAHTVEEWRHLRAYPVTGVRPFLHRESRASRSRGHRGIRRRSRHGQGLRGAAGRCLRNGYEIHLKPGAGNLDFGDMFRRVEGKGFKGHYTNAFATLDDMLAARGSTGEIARKAPEWRFGAVRRSQFPAGCDAVEGDRQAKSTSPADPGDLNGVFVDANTSAGAAREQPLQPTRDCSAPMSHAGHLLAFAALRSSLDVRCRSRQRTRSGRKVALHRSKTPSRMTRRFVCIPDNVTYLHGSSVLSSSVPPFGDLFRGREGWDQRALFVRRLTR